MSAAPLWWLLSLASICAMAALYSWLNERRWYPWLLAGVVCATVPAIYWWASW